LGLDDTFGEALFFFRRFLLSFTMIHVKFRDTDPDTGIITQDEVIVMSENPDRATWAKMTIEKDWFDHNPDHNREFYLFDTETEQEF
jgi:hypothetical protein